MKKIICVNNQEDLVKALSNIENETSTFHLQKKIFGLINHTKEDINAKVINSKDTFRKKVKQEDSREKSNQKNLKENHLSKKNLIVIDYLLINNLGITLLKETINYYNKYQHLILLNVGDSLSFLLFAIENNFNFISTTIKNHDITNIKELAKKQNCKIFNFTENIFECLIVN